MGGLNHCVQPHLGWCFKVTSIFSGGKTNNRLHLNMIERNQTILTILMISGLVLGMEKSIQQPTMSSPKLCRIYRKKNTGLPALAGPQTRRPDQAEEDKRHQENQNRQLSYWPLPATGQSWEIRWKLGIAHRKGWREWEPHGPLTSQRDALADLASATSFLPSEIEGKTSTHIWRCWMMIWT